MNKTIEVLASHTQTDVLNGQSNIYADHFDTLKEARAYAKRTLTEEFRVLIEASECQRYAQVLVDGECVNDYFAKGYNGEGE
jgi:hypothetical protein